MHKIILAVCTALVLIVVSPAMAGAAKPKFVFPHPYPIQFAMADAAAAAMAHVDKSLNPFADEDNGTVVTPKGTIVHAALPPITEQNEQAIFGKLNVKLLIKNDVPGGGISLVVNQCEGPDVALSFNEWFYYHGKASAVTFCGHPFPPGTSS